MPSTNLRLLLVEDSNADATLVLRALRQSGFIVESTRVEAEEDYCAQLESAPDIILSDYNLPQFGAMRALELLRGRDLDIPFIIVSGSIGEEIAVQAIQQGASDYLLKDRLGRLGSAVSHVLNAKQLRDAKKEAEQALRTAQIRLQHVVATSPAILFTLGVSGESLSLIWLSENVQHILGYTVAEAYQPKWWEDRVHPADLDGVVAAIKAALPSKEALAQEYRFRHSDGQYRWVRSELKFLRDSQHRPIEVVGSWSDITERKLLEQQYHQSQKMEAFGQLAGGVAHDFNNLLTVITGYSEMILTGMMPLDNQYEMTREIRKAGDRAASLTRQLLAFSRKQMLQPVELDLNGLVSELEKMLRRLIGEDIDLATALDPALGPVKADPGQIEQVIMNLVVNARDAMPQGGHLTIETRNTELDATYAQQHFGVNPGRFVMLAVADTGCGMDQATKAKVFEPFFTTKEVGKGTGLGLATVHGIVKQSGGNIEVYSEAGRGTTFKIYLPQVDDKAPTGKSFPGMVLTPRGTETILLAEDEEGVRAISRLALESQGYTVLAATNGAEALEICQQASKPIHLLMTDIVMPKISGRHLANLVAATHPQMKVLFLSGYTDDAIVRHGVLEAGAAFLQKPFTPTTLVRKVREVLDKPEGNGAQ